MKNILVATDFSNNAYNALFFATELFKERKCNFYLLNAYTELTKLISQKVAAGSRPSLIEQLSEESAEGLNEVYHRIHLDQNNPLHQFKTLSRNGHLADIANEAIDHYQIDLMVMGHKGKAIVENLFIGSTVSKAIDEISECPLLIVPKEIECRIPKEIAFATDYRHPYDAGLIQPLKELTALTGASVRIVHINEEERLSTIQKTNLNTLREYLTDIDHSIHWMPDFTNKSGVIRTFVDELNIELLTMIKYEHGLFSQLIREPVFHKLIFSLDIPFLVMPAGNSRS
ncbi:MAG: universal stress protein [Flavobacteriaceae bacterium]